MDVAVVTLVAILTTVRALAPAIGKCVSSPTVRALGALTISTSTSWLPAVTSKVSGLWSLPHSHHQCGILLDHVIHIDVSRELVVHVFSNLVLNIAGLVAHGSQNSMESHIHDGALAVQELLNGGNGFHLPG